MLSIPNSAQDLSATELRRQLAVVKSALDSRDGWNRAAHEHESASFSTTGSGSSSSSHPHLGAGRSRGGAGVIKSNKGDLALKPPGNRVPRIPKSLRNQIVWISGSMELSTITWSTSVVIENNYSFILQNLPNYTSCQNLFDQYCIAQASVSLYSGYPPGATGTPPKLYTAIDFDNSTNLGTVAAIEAYASCKIVDFTIGKVVTRSVSPCVKTNVSNVANAGVAQSWVDCAQSSINHFGIRTMFGISGSSYSCQPTLQLVVAFRNVI